MNCNMCTGKTTGRQYLTLNMWEWPRGIGAKNLLLSNESKGRKHGYTPMGQLRLPPPLDLSNRITLALSIAKQVEGI